VIGTPSASVTGAPSASVIGASVTFGLALQVHEMFPSLPVPAVLAALQDAPVAAVIERALAGRVDPNAVPRPADPAKLQVIR